MVEEQMSPEAALALQKEQCIFCQIVSGKRPGLKVYEDDLVIAILDIAPAAPGHVLLMPKEHYPIMPMVPEKVLAHTFRIAKGISQALLQSLVVSGTNIFVANGGLAGQQIPHFMVHIVPREEDDGVDVFKLGETVVDPSALLEMQKALAGSLQMKLQDKLAEQGLVKVKEVTYEELFKSIDANPKLKEVLVANVDKLETLIASNPQFSALMKGKDVAKIKEFLLKGKGEKQLKAVSELLAGKKVERKSKEEELLKEIEDETSEETPEEKALREKLSVKNAKKKKSKKEKTEEELKEEAEEEIREEAEERKKKAEEQEEADLDEITAVLGGAK